MYKSRKKYRLMFVNDNTFNTVWTMKLSRAKVWVLTAVCCAAIAALAVGIFVWSPLKNYLPGYIRPAEREQIVDNTLRIDSMLVKTDVNQQYIDNIMSILSGDGGVVTAPDFAPEDIADTLMVASEAERAFVADWMERERGNLSVLTPIAAEGMMFRLPAPGATITDESTLQAARGATVTAIQDATVIDAHVDPLTGRHTIILQHSNDFLSTYSGLATRFVAPGQHVMAGHALGALGSDGKLRLSVWHQGARTPLRNIIPQ